MTGISAILFLCFVWSLFNIPAGDDLPVGLEMHDELVQTPGEGRGVEGKELGPQGHVQGRHPGAAPEGAALVALAGE